MRFKNRLTTLVLLTTMALVTTVGCSTAGSTSSKEATPTPIPPPPVPEKPTYTVKRGTVVDSLSFTGRVSPSVEQELFFKDAGRVKKVYVARNDAVEQGTLLAELENDDLVRQLTQAELSLEAANLNLKDAQEAQDYAIQKATNDLEVKKLELAKLQASIESSTDTADVAIAQANLKQAQDALRAAQARANAGLDPVSVAKREADQANNSLWGAQARRDEACAGSRSAACDGAKASVLNAEIDVQNAQANLQAVQASPSEVDAATIAVQIAQANYQRATSKTNTSQFDLDIEKLSVQQAELDLERLKKGLDPQLAKAVEQAKLAVERLQSQVDNTRISSPIAGKVTSVSAYEGRAIDAYKAVFVVADETKLEVTAEPMSSQMDKLSEGMAAAIILSSYPGKELVGKIITLPYPYGTGGSATIASTDTEGTDKLTHIQFDPEDLNLAPGDLVKVIVTLQKKDDVLWLPPAAIRTFSGRKFVVIDDGGVQRRVDVTIGIESAERVEITEGLQENQVVIGQ